MSIKKDETFRMKLDRCRFSYYNFVSQRTTLEDAEKDLTNLVDYIDKYVADRVDEAVRNNEEEIKQEKSEAIKFIEDYFQAERLNREISREITSYVYGQKTESDTKKHSVRMKELMMSMCLKR